MKKVLFGTILLISAFVVSVSAQTKYTDAEGDELVARLQQADVKIVALEQQVRDCTRKYDDLLLKFNDTPVATVYFYEGSSEVSQLNKNVLKALAQEMKKSENKYILTGWADDYTGSDKVNEKLKKSRVENVKTLLVKFGVDENKLKSVVGQGNLVGVGEKSASLDRAVTILIEK